MATTYGFANRLTLRRHGRYVAVGAIDKTTHVRRVLQFPTREQAVEAMRAYARRVGDHERSFIVLPFDDNEGGD